MRFKKAVSKFYKKIKLNILKNIFNNMEGESEVSSLDYFCLECIYLMDCPTISQFAAFMDISSPNATYKVKQLINKGYITKEKSENDGREYRLVPTQKFFDHFENKDDYVVANELKQNMTKKECKKMDKIMKILNDQIEEV